MIRLAAGDRFGRLTFVEQLPALPAHLHRVARWRCDCGALTVVATTRVKNGYTKSCGCLVIENSRRVNLKHGMRRSPEYTSWTAMKMRCLVPSNKDYPRWGGRGVTVCGRWRDSFEDFLADMGPKPSPRHTLDRWPNNDGNYEPGNCRWATPKEQALNRRARVNRRHL
jgi:hypothetical protein